MIFYDKCRDTLDQHEEKHVRDGTAQPVRTYSAMKSYCRSTRQALLMLDRSHLNSIRFEI